MNEIVSETLVTDALANCASEPVHIPGCIQPFGWMLAYQVKTGRLDYVSANIADLLGKAADTLLGTPIDTVLDAEALHDIQNGISHGGVAKRRMAGLWARGDRDFGLFTWISGDHVVVEIEEATDGELRPIDLVRKQTMLINLMREAETIDTLLDLTTRYLRSITEFDRVMVYQFDQDWNGTIIKEARRASLEPFLGLRFPSWDIPAQAREIMARIPLRLIGDVDDRTVPLLAANAALPPLDISLAETRGVSPVHLQYLRNMGSQATMTLSVVVEKRLWGIISFHNATPQLVPPQLRFMLSEVLSVFCIKLELLHQQSAISVSTRLDGLLEEMHGQIRRVSDLDELLKRAGQEVCSALSCTGLAIQTDKDLFTYGEVPGQAAIRALVDKAKARREEFYVTTCLSEALPDYKPALHGVAGAHVALNSEKWALLVFRPEVTREIAWAGDPAKTVEVVDGNARLNPRGSFKTFLTKVQSHSEPWLPETLMLARKLWPVMGVALAAEQRLRYMESLDKQRQLMIDELNHRVRNILSLVRSVSSQARRSNASLESYSASIESRIRALAAAHDIGAGAAVSAVSMREILSQEVAPFHEQGAERMKVSGPDIVIKAEFAPIMALVIHELMTNAAKYGALSRLSGWIEVTLTKRDTSYGLQWKEHDGPQVTEPSEKGFGTTLIQNAIPYELHGTSELIFEPDGILATLSVPNTVTFEEPVPSLKIGAPQTGQSAQVEVPASVLRGSVLIVENNFMIAEDLRKELHSAGFQSVECASSVAEAVEVMNDTMPSVALLDINLGEGQTTVPIAELLQSWKVPFLFVTGYGDLNTLPPHLSDAPVLTKPVAPRDLINMIALSVISAGIE